MEQKHTTQRWFYHTGGLGDIVYSLPTVKAMGGGGFIVNMSKPEYDSIRPLLLAQPYIKAVHHVSTFGLPANFVDLTIFRNHPLFTRLHIAELHAQMQKVDITGWKNGWLEGIRENPFGRQAAIFNVTERYRDRFFNWTREVKRQHKARNFKPIGFIGLAHEYDHFISDLNRNTYIMPHYTGIRTLLDAAKILSQTSMFCGNQSAMLAVRQGLGLPYRFEQSPNHLDTEQGDNPSENETIINPFTRRLHLATVCMKKMLFDNKQKRYHA